MPTRDPKFVRLADHLSLGSQVHLASGWGITGHDVRNFPDGEVYGREAQQWVRQRIRDGVLEEASQAEWDEVHEDDLSADLGDVSHVVFHDASEPLPENQLRDMHERASRKRAKSREARLAEAEGGEGESGEPEDPYMAMNKQELRDEVEIRNAEREEAGLEPLHVSGTSRELADRLREDDTERATTEETSEGG